MRSQVASLMLGGWLLSLICPGVVAQGQHSEPTKLPHEDCSDTRAILDVTSERMLFDQQTRTFTFEEKVRVHRCDMIMSCDRLHVINDVKGEHIERITAIGNVHFQRGTQHVIAERAEFFPAEQRLMLTGNPRAWDTQEQQEMTGEEISVFLQRENMVVKRARVLFHPRKVLSKVP
jgi:lipopolysaccharide transport protein LptA